VKGFVSIGVAIFLLLTAAFPAQSHSNQLLLGTQLHLVLLNGLTAPSRATPIPFAAVVTEPVYLGG
jgi:Na+/H+-dicarboxylate symporter